MYEDVTTDCVTERNPEPGPQHKLFGAVVDVDHKAYCGPCAISALTGVPVSRIEAMLRRKRRGWQGPIKGTYDKEVISVLERLGCKVTEMKNPESTFARFAADTGHIRGAYLVGVTRHYMAVSHGWYCDSAAREPKLVTEHRRANRRIKHVWRIEAPTVPRLGPVVAKPVIEKPKPDIKQVRYNRLIERIAAWESKQKRAENALKKLRRQQAYYLRLLSGSVKS